MPHLIWTPEALDDIDRLYLFLATRSEDAAARAARRIIEGVAVLADHPRIGRPVPDRGPDHREWPIRFGSGGYTVLYRFDGEDVVLVAVKSTRERDYD